MKEKDLSSWRVSTYCGPSGGCVGVARLGEVVLVADMAAPAGSGSLVLSQTEFGRLLWLARVRADVRGGSDAQQ